MGNNTLTSLGSTYRTAQLGVGTIPYDAGNTKKIDLPVTLLNKSLTVRLQGNVIVATQPGTTANDKPLGLIKKLELIANGSRTIFSATGRQLWAYARFMTGKYGETFPGLSSVGTRPFSATIHLDHEAVHFFNPVESLFDATRYKTLELKITWGQAADIVQAGVGGTVAIDTANTYADVMLEASLVGQEQIMFDHLITTQTAAVVSTNPRFAFDVPQTGLLAGIMISTTRDAGAGLGPTPVDDLVNSISLKSDTTVTHVDSVRWATMQARNMQKYQIDGGSAASGGRLVGHVYVPLHENGMFSSALNVAAINKTQLVLDVTRTSDTELVEVLFDFFEPLRAA